MTHSIVRRGRRALALAAPVGLLALGACNLDVTTPDVVLPSTLGGASSNSARLAAAVGDFTAAYSGFSDGNAGDGIVLLSGLFSDEFTAADLFAEHSQVDARRVSTSNTINGGVLRALLRSLNSAQNAADAYAQFGESNSADRAHALNLVGFDYVLVAENYCSGTPFSTIDASGVVHYGSSLSTAQMLTAAKSAFTTAAQVATAAHDNQQLQAAQVGLGRTLLDMGDFAGAAAAVANVDPDFVYATEQGVTSSRQKSGLYELFYNSTRYSVSNAEGTTGLSFVTSGDPRTATVALGRSQFDNLTPIYAPEKYGDYTAPTVIASGVEAQLIRAEAAYRANNYAGANGTLSILNSLRAAADLGPLAPAATPTAQVTQLFNERANFLFATAHRTGDFRRLITQYNRGAETVFPTGAYRKGGNYGAQVSLLVPQDESQNPNYNPSSCDPTKP